MARASLANIGETGGFTGRSTATPAYDPAPMDDRIAVNRAMWDERVPLHVGSDFYDVDSFRAGRLSLQPFEIQEVGDVSGRSLLHLQCHFGLDTLSWARLGAAVTGLDFSPQAVEAATALAAEAGLAERAEFVCSDVYETRAA